MTAAWRGECTTTVELMGVGWQIDPMANLELYELDGCPYCIRVKEKLADLDLEYESHMVPASHGEREEVREISGQTGVPVLVDHDHGIEGMAESAAIIDYLEETYGEGAA